MKLTLFLNLLLLMQLAAHASDCNNGAQERKSKICTYGRVCDEATGASADWHLNIGVDLMDSFMTKYDRPFHKENKEVSIGVFEINSTENIRGDHARSVSKLVQMRSSKVKNRANVEFKVK